MDEVYDLYFDKIYNYYLKKTRNKEDTLDLTNDVFVAVFTYISNNISIEKLDNLIWKIAYNIWCTRAKKYIKEKENIEYLDIYNSLDTSLLDKIIYKELIENIDLYNLTEKEKTSFVLYYLNDFSVKEISIKLNTSESNVKYYLYSARNKIKERYNEK